LGVDEETLARALSLSHLTAISIHSRVYTDGIVFCVSYGAKMALEKQENQINVNKSCSGCGCSNVAAQDFSVASEPRVTPTSPACGPAARC
ncbi:hypothetical protein ACTXQV_64630, partial [Klebsiella pneumoniae]